MNECMVDNVNENLDLFQLLAQTMEIDISQNRHITYETYHSRSKDSDIYLYSNILITVPLLFGQFVSQLS